MHDGRGMKANSSSPSDATSWVRWTVRLGTPSCHNREPLVSGHRYEVPVGPSQAQNWGVIADRRHWS